ncbi:MAG: NUDIX hydrolase [Candidatus Krumholzibacteria bacterium]|nr:NUDIX hydrolase [Candidatus Krumholzibacteria bacterium]
MSGNFKFCPLCGVGMSEREEGGLSRMACPGCGFIHYHNPAPAAGILVRDEEGRILLVKRRFDPYRGLWTIPSGYIEYDEDVRLTAVRELEEETGLVVGIDGIYSVESCFDDPRGNTLVVMYEGHVKGGRLRAGDDAEDAVFFSPGDLPPIAFDCQKKILSLITGGKV